MAENNLTQMEIVDTQKSVTSELVSTEIKELILFNDDFNTFDHVINSLVEICGHEILQAEQCAFIVHYKGKCVIKKGSLKELMVFKNALQQRTLTVAIN